MELEALGEVQRDNVAVQTTACELQRLFVNGSEGQDVVLGCQRVEARIL